MKKFRVTGKKGIDDLKDRNPYYGDWGNFCPAFDDVTQESYKADKTGYEQRVAQWNKSYVESLKTSGEYGQEYHTDFEFNEIPEFDNNKAPDYSNFGLFIPAGNIDKAYDNPKMSYVFKKDEDENKNNK